MCVEDGCARTKIFARGMCGPHYQRRRLGGELKPITLIDRFNAKTNKAANGCWEWTGARTKHGYGHLWDGNTARRAHRISFEMHVGPIPDGLLVDHICLNRACVNPDHLRLATKKQNNEHLSDGRVNNTSGYRGVSWHKAVGKWTAYASHNGQIRYLGCFESKEDAAEAARLKRLEMYTHNDLDRTA
jgi:hypothetical protein